MIAARTWVVDNVLKVGKNEKDVELYEKSRINFPSFIDSLSPTGFVTFFGFFLCVSASYFLKCIEK